VIGKVIVSRKEGKIEDGEGLKDKEEGL